MASSLALSRRCLILGGFGLVGGMVVPVAGCGSGSDGGCGGNPSRASNTPPVVEGNEYILANTSRGNTSTLFLGNSRSAETAPAMFNNEGRLAVSQSYTLSDRCGATLYNEPQMWISNLSGRGGRIETLGRETGSIVPVVINDAGILAGFEAAVFSVNRIVLLNPVAGIPSARWQRRELSLFDSPLREKSGDFFLADIHSGGTVLCNTLSRAFTVSFDSLTILPDLTNDRTEDNLPSQRFTARVLQEDGTIIGYSQRLIDQDRFPEYSPDAEASYFFRNGTYTELGKPDGFDRVKAVHANAAGQIVGTVRPVGSDVVRAFLWENGQFTLFGPEGFSPRAIAGDGAIVGRVQNRATLWQNGNPIDLNTQIDNGSGYELQDAFSINQRGQIVAQASHNGQAWLVVLTRA